MKMIKLQSSKSKQTKHTGTEMIMEMTMVLGLWKETFSDSNHKNGVCHLKLKSPKLQKTHLPLKRN